MDFSNQYNNLFLDAKELFNDVKLINCSDISGSNAYCDKDAEKAICSRISDNSPEGIHIIDSGNYHYVSLFWIKKLDYDFSLVLFDNHPDMQAPAFGDILSCGSWIKNALEECPHLKEVYMFGVNKTLLQELSPLDKRIHTDDRLPMDSRYPLYISIDKDVLPPEYAACDWDQGDMSYEHLCEHIKSLFNNNRIIGVDICGDKKTNPTEQELALNAKINKSLMALIVDFSD